MSNSESDLRFEIGHVLFIDIVGYSKLLIEDQKERLRQLTEIVLATAQVREATDEQLVRLPTGDGMALVFRHSAEEPARCALEIAEALRKHPELPVRMGIHSGPVSEVTDVSGRTNIAGAGINLAQRVMDCGDAGHILLSKRVAADMEQYGHWQPQLHDLGDCEVKHGVRLGLVNLYTDGIGNQRLPKKLQALRQRKRMRWAAVASLLLLALAVGAFFLFMRKPMPSLIAAANKSIAVLPFENLGAADQAYFAAGVTEEVTLQLAKLRSLRVMSRNAVARFASGAAALPAMTRELGVGAVLTGTVRYSGEHVRVGVQLLAAPSGETLWGEQYERSLANIFDVQSDIALRVARALQASLAPEERARIERAPTDNAEAYQLFLQQRQIKEQPPERNAEGIALLQKAIALDARFALAYASLARRFVIRGNVTGREDYLRAVETARTAVALDPQLSRAHYSLGLSLSFAGFPDESRLAMQRALELDPNSDEAMDDLSVMECYAGHLDQSFYWAKRALPLAPNLPNSHVHLALPLISLDAPLAERFLRAAARRFKPDEPGGGMRIVILLAVLDLHRGNPAAGLDRIRQAVAALPTEFEGQLALMEFAVYAGAADADQIVDAALKKSAETRAFYGPYTAQVFRAFLWLRAGEPDRARPLIDAAMATASAAIENGDRGVDLRYQHAALHLMRGDREAALTAFEGAIDAGLREPQLPRRDPLLAPLRTEPRFIAAMERVDRDIAAMRPRVDFREVEEWASSAPRSK